MSLFPSPHQRICRIKTAAALWTVFKVRPARLFPLQASRRSPFPGQKRGNHGDDSSVSQHPFLSEASLPSEENNHLLFPLPTCPLYSPPPPRALSAGGRTSCVIRSTLLQPVTFFWRCKIPNWDNIYFLLLLSSIGTSGPLPFDRRDLFFGSGGADFPSCEGPTPFLHLLSVLGAGSLLPPLPRCSPQGGFAEPFFFPSVPEFFSLGRKDWVFPLPPFGQAAGLSRIGRVSAF